MSTALYIAIGIAVVLAGVVALFVFRKKLHFRDAAEKLTGK